MGTKNPTSKDIELIPGHDLDVRICEAAGLKPSGVPLVVADVDDWLHWYVCPSRKLDDAVIAAEQVTDCGRIVIECIDRQDTKKAWHCYLKCSTTACEVETFGPTAALTVCKAILALSDLNKTKDWRPKWAPGRGKARWMKDLRKKATAKSADRTQKRKRAE